jgi:hypothetical protein
MWHHNINMKFVNNLYNSCWKLKQDVLCTLWYAKWIYCKHMCCIRDVKCGELKVEWIVLKDLQIHEWKKVVKYTRVTKRNDHNTSFFHENFMLERFDLLKLSFVLSSALLTSQCSVRRFLKDTYRINHFPSFFLSFSSFQFFSLCPIKIAKFKDRKKNEWHRIL